MQKSIVITDDGCFICAVNNIYFDKEMNVLIRIMLRENNLNHNYYINIYTFN